MKKWIKIHKKQLLQLLLAFGIGVVISSIFLLVFGLTGVISFKGDVRFNAELFNELRGNPLLYIVFVLVMAISGTLLCMNPVGSGVFVWS